MIGDDTELSNYVPQSCTHAIVRIMNVKLITNGFTTIYLLNFAANCWYQGYKYLNLITLIKELEDFGGS